jgi:hypothetical protein
LSLLVSLTSNFVVLDNEQTHAQPVKPLNITTPTPTRLGWHVFCFSNLTVAWLILLFYVSSLDADDSHQRSHIEGAGVGGASTGVVATWIVDYPDFIPIRVTVMVDDNMSSLGQVFQRFLKDQGDVLDDLREALCGEDPIGSGASDALLGRFERWLDERSGVTDIAHRATLMQVAQAFIDLAAEPKGAQSLALV